MSEVPLYPSLQEGGPYQKGFCKKVTLADYVHTRSPAELALTPPLPDLRSLERTECNPPHHVGRKAAALCFSTIKEFTKTPAFVSDLLRTAGERLALFIHPQPHRSRCPSTPPPPF